MKRFDSHGTVQIGKYWTRSDIIRNVSYSRIEMDGHELLGIDLSLSYSGSVVEGTELI